MTLHRLLGLAVVVLSMSLAPAFAQDGPKGGGGAGGAGGGGNGAGGGVSGVSGGGNSPGAGGGGGSSFGSGGGDMGGGSSMSSSSPDWGTFRGNRSAGGLGTRGGRAAEPSYARSVPPGGGGGDAVRSDGRSRGDRPVLGLAVERTSPIERVRGGGAGFINSRYYDPFGFGYGYSPYSSYCGFAYSYCNYGYGYYGLNSLYFDPYWLYGAQAGGVQGPPINIAQGLGSLRLKIKPNKGEVFVDGYYVGSVDEFDGAFQKLPLEQGHHRVEVRLLGYEPLVFDIDIRRGQTTLFEGQLRPRQ